jgi:hypothetical protein
MYISANNVPRLSKGMLHIGIRATISTPNLHGPVTTCKYEIADLRFRGCLQCVCHIFPCKILRKLLEILGKLRSWGLKPQFYPMFKHF